MAAVRRYAAFCVCAVKEDDIMSQIQVTDLTFSYDTHYEMIFDHVNALLDTSWKTGLMAEMGRERQHF